MSQPVRLKVEGENIKGCNLKHAQDENLCVLWNNKTKKIHKENEPAGETEGIRIKSFTSLFSNKT